MKNLFCFCAALLIAGFCAASCHSAEDEKLSQENQAIVKEKREKIMAEIETLKDHPWAGRYYQGDGLGANLSLVIAPESGLTFTWYGCMGLYDQNYGKVIRDGDRVKLELALENNGIGFSCPAFEFTPIRWGERVYLISPDEIIDFCNAINSRSEPRKGPHGFFFLHDDDWEKEVAGPPELSGQYLQYLLENPVDAAITSVLKTEPSPVYNNRTKITVLIDKGKNDGLLPGMKLHVTKPEMIFDEVVLTKIEETQSEGVFDYSEKSPEIGWKVSTCPSWRRNDRPAPPPSREPSREAGSRVGRFFHVIRKK